MQNKKIKRMLALTLTAVLSLTACGQAASKNESSSPAKEESKVESVVTSESAKEESKEEPKEIVTVSMYPSGPSLTSGVVGSWRADMLADIGVELEVWAFSEEKSNAILASEELPDLFYVNNADQLEVLLENDLILDITPYLDKFDHISDYYSSWDVHVANQQSKDTGFAAVFGNDDYAGKFYVMPGSVGDAVYGSHSLTAFTDRWQVRLNWAAYESVGAPEITNWTELLDVVEMMLEANPKSADGHENYAIFLEDGTDGIATKWDPVNLFLRWNAYTDLWENWGYLGNLATSEIEDVYADNGIYYQGVKWLNEAWNRGLIEPDSINTPRADANYMTKYTMLPCGTLPGYAPGCLELYMPGTVAWTQKVVSKLAPGVAPSASGWVISKECENVDAVIDLLALWADNDKVLEWNWGPEGDIWYLDDKGNASLTEEYLDYVVSGSKEGFKLSSGDPWVYWNHVRVASDGSPTSYGDGKGGFKSNHIQEWKEYELKVASESETFKNWQETTGYTSWEELVLDKDALVTYSPIWLGRNYVTDGLAEADDALVLQMQSCLTALQDYSWKMLVAPTEEEFNKLWAELKETVAGYGLADVQKFFMETYNKGMEQMKADGYGPDGEMIANWDELYSKWHK